MRFVGNIIWFILGGAVLAAVWLLGAFVFACSIIGLPLTKSAIEMAKMSAWPFGKDVIHVRELDNKDTSAVTALTGTVGFITNVVWACSFGIILFAFYVIAGILNCLTIIGIPFGLQAFKLAGISFWPVGRRVVSVELAKAARKANAENQLSALRQTGDETE